MSLAMYEPLPPENPSQVEPDEVNVGLLGVVGTFLAVVVVLIVVLLQAWFYNWRASMRRRQDPARPTAPRRRWAGRWSNSRKRSTATTGSIARPASGRSRSSGRWNWWPRKWRPHRSPRRNRRETRWTMTAMSFAERVAIAPVSRRRLAAAASDASATLGRRERSGGC